MRTKTHNSPKRSNSSSPPPPPRQQPTRTEFSAGGIIFQRTPRGPLVAFLLDPYGKWTFPKGHVRRAAGEPAADAARREAEEEIGIGGIRVVEKLGTAEIWFQDRFKHKGTLVHKYITYFLMEAPTGSVGYPETEELIKAVAWAPLSEVMDLSSYENLAPVLKKAINRIAQLTRPPAVRPAQPPHQPNRPIVQ